MAFSAGARAETDSFETDPFAKANRMTVRVVVLVHRVDDLAGEFVEALNTYPPRADYPFDAFAGAIRDCLYDAIDSWRVLPNTFGREIGSLTLDVTYDGKRFTESDLVVTTFHDLGFEQCVGGALQNTIWHPTDDVVLRVSPSDRLRISVRLSFENSYVVRRAKVDAIARCDVVRFRQDDPRLPRMHDAKSMKVSGIRCATDTTYIAEKILGKGWVLLEREPNSQPGIQFEMWREAYVRLPDGRDYGLELIKAGICDDSGEKHPRSYEYRRATKKIRKIRGRRFAN